MRESAPPGAAVSTVRHRVAFYETDAMGIVHHANHVRFFENARVAWMREHHRPYTDYMTEGRNFATTLVEAEYRRPLVFDAEIEIDAWLESVGGASIRIGYAIRDAGALAAVGATEHALIDDTGRPRRIPKALREELGSRLGSPVS